MALYALYAGEREWDDEDTMGKKNNNNTVDSLIYIPGIMRVNSPFSFVT